MKVKTKQLHQSPKKPALNRLIRWFQANKRVFPWRPRQTKPASSTAKTPGHATNNQSIAEKQSHRDPYFTWISEIMLQQTRSEAVIGHFTRWISRFPDLQTLAHSPEADVLEAWQGLGYYSRARNILKTANILVHENQGRFPQSRKELEALPGIGPYTAGAILSLCFNLPEAILDGNLVRIFSRLYCINQLPSESSVISELYWEISRNWAEKTDTPGLLNEALMELGATICTPTSPKCKTCPLQPMCAAWEQDKQSEYPPIKKKPKPILLKPQLLLIYITDDQTVMLAKQNSLLLKNQWMIPAWWEASEQKDLHQKLQSLDKQSRHSLKKLNPKALRHSITKYKIEADIWCLELNSTSSGFFDILDLIQPPNSLETEFIHSQDAQKMVQSSLAIKALKLLEKQVSQ